MDITRFFDSAHFTFLRPYAPIASKSISPNSRLSDSPSKKSPAVVMMRSSCADVPDEIKRRRFPRASERSTFAVVFPPAAPLTLMTVGMILFTFGCHATISAAFLPVLPPIMVVCAPPSLFWDMTSYCAILHIKKPLHDTLHVLVSRLNPSSCACC